MTLLGHARPTRPRTLRSVLLAVAWMLSTPVWGMAQDDGDDAYRTVISEAVAEQGAGNFEEAYALFERAHGMNPNARTARALGAMAFELRRYPESIRWAELALAETRRPLTDEQRSEVVDLLRRAQLRVGTLLVEVPPGAELFVDGLRTALAPSGGIMISVGSHRLEARFPDGRRAIEEVPVSAQETRTVRLVPPPIPTSTGVGRANPNPIPVAEDPRVPELEPRRSPAWILGWTAVGLTAVGAGIAVAGYLVYADAQRAWDESPPCQLMTGTLTNDCQELRDNEERGERMILAGSILAGAFLVSGVVLVIVGRPRGTSSGQARLQCAPGLAGVSCAGTF